MKQGPDESVSRYFYRVQSTMRKAQIRNPVDTHTISYLLPGLVPHLHQIYWENHSLPLEEILRLWRMEEAVISVMEAQPSGEGYSTNQQDHRRPFCSYCNRPNHTYQLCRVCCRNNKQQRAHQRKQSHNIDLHPSDQYRLSHYSDSMRAQYVSRHPRNHPYDRNFDNQSDYYDRNTCMLAHGGHSEKILPKPKEDTRSNQPYNTLTFFFFFFLN
jgi:hypothetical protein